MVRNLPVVHAHWISRVAKFLRLDRQVSRLFLDQYVTLGVDVATYGLDLKSVKVDEQSSGIHNIINAVSGMKIKVYRVVLVVADVLGVLFMDGADDLTGSMDFVNGGEGFCVSAVPPDFLFECFSNFRIYLDASVKVGGWLNYWREKA